LAFALQKLLTHEAAMFPVAPRLGEQLPKKEQQRRSSGD
jgi:hypothetical protein